MAESNRPGDRAVDADLDDLLSDDLDESDGRDDKTRVKDTSVKGTVTRSGRQAETGKRIGIFARFVRFVREIVAELRKVIWPTRKELLTYTAVVIVFVTIMLTIVGLLDVAFARVLLLVFGGGTAK